MKASAEISPLINCLRSSNGEVIRELMKLLSEEYPALCLQRQAHKELHRAVRDYNPTIATLDTSPALELVEHCIDRAREAKPEEAELRVQEALSSAYELMAQRASESRGLSATEEMLEIARVGRALAQIGLIWAHLRMAEVELISSDEPTEALQELDMAHMHVRDVVGTDHELARQIQLTSAALMH